MKITKRELKEILKEEIEVAIDEAATLKIPVEKYDAFKRKIEQWGMLFNKFTGYTRDLNNQSFDRKTDGKRIARMAYKLESEFRKIMKEFDFDAKSYDDERFAMRQKLDRFDGDSEFFLEGHGAEGSMARSQLGRTAEIAMMLQDMIEDESDLEEWVESKITKSQDYLSSVLNYMRGSELSELDTTEED
tara:strand:+ start:120 stop:686 length:567 start_codon:yes stop_codon:yes gene_type:complete